MRYKIVVRDSDLAYRKEIERNVNFNLSKFPPHEREKRYKPVEQRVISMIGKPKPVGHVHDVAEIDCPDDGINCRNCGDPTYQNSCKASGHCPNCGTKHGIAPDSVVVANGYELVVE